MLDFIFDHLSSIKNAFYIFSRLEIVCVNWSKESFSFVTCDYDPKMLLKSEMPKWNENIYYLLWYFIQQKFTKSVEQVVLDSCITSCYIILIFFPFFLLDWGWQNHWEKMEEIRKMKLFFKKDRKKTSFWCIGWSRRVNREKDILSKQGENKWLVINSGSNVDI